MTILNSLATYTNQYILLFGIFASTTVYLVYSLIKTIRDNSNNSNSEDLNLDKSNYINKNSDDLNKNLDKS